MTKHAFQNANSVLTKSHHTFTRNPWVLEEEATARTASSTGSQGHTASYYIEGLGPPATFAYTQNPYVSHAQQYADQDSVSAVLRYTSQPCSDQESATGVAYGTYLEGPSNAAYALPTYSNQDPATSLRYARDYHPLNDRYAHDYVQTMARSATLPYRKSHQRKRSVTMSESPMPFDCGRNGGHSMSVLNSSTGTPPDRPITPVSINDGVADPCGGHCRTCERFCHYILQVLFVVGMLCGVSLVLAAYWLQEQRGGDKLVLVYIGVLMALVCTLLLSIQCSAERDAKRRKSARHQRRHAAADQLPLRVLGSAAAAATSQMPLVHQRHIYHAHQSPYDEVTESQNGIPWWRRQGQEMQVTQNYDNFV